jgi:hypothetical protein
MASQKLVPKRAFFIFLLGIFSTLILLLDVCTLAPGFRAYSNSTREDGAYQLANNEYNPEQASNPSSMGDPLGTTDDEDGDDYHISHNNELSSSEQHNRVEDQELHLDMVVFLAGETANELLKMAQGHVIQSIASKLDPPIHLSLRYRVRNKPKSKYARGEIQDCFYNFDVNRVDLFEFEEDVHDEMWNNQTSVIQDLLQIDASELLIIEGQEYNETSIEFRLKQIRALTNQMASANKLIQSNDDSKPILSTPHLMTSDMFDILSGQALDKYYQELRELFSFNEERCCEDVPEPDETVFHVRGFKQEIPYHRDKYDAWPKIASEMLIPDLQEGDKVVVLAGKDGLVNVTEYKEVFEERGIETRASKNVKGIHDFCQLLKAKKEVIGNLHSTYFTWGAMFGSSEKVVIYSPMIPYEYPFLPNFPSYNFTHPYLKSRNLTTLILQHKKY